MYVSVNTKDFKIKDYSEYIQHYGIDNVEPLIDYVLKNIKHIIE
jgi:hypothetical protein